MCLDYGKNLLFALVQIWQFLSHALAHGSNLSLYLVKEVVHKAGVEIGYPRYMVNGLMLNTVPLYGNSVVYNILQNISTDDSRVL